MPWIDVIDNDDADGELAEIYNEMIEKRGKVSNIMKIHSLLPVSMKNHMDLYMTIMFGRSGLSREERELIGVVVSSANSCLYCVSHHVEALNFYWKDDEKVRTVVKDFRALDLDERIGRMLDYAERLTLYPASVDEESIVLLREVGFTDQDILTINLIVSYFNFVNRIVLGLGVEFSEEEKQGYKY